jgi:transcriptional regulator with XRE-family HTH domain
MFTNKGINIKLMMLQAGVTGAEIARENNCSRSYISHVVTGRSENKEIREAIASKIGCDVLDLWPS